MEPSIANGDKLNKLLQNNACEILKVFTRKLKLVSF